MASLEVDQLKTKSMFNEWVHSEMIKALAPFGVTVNGSDPGKSVKSLSNHKVLNLAWFTK